MQWTAGPPPPLNRTVGKRGEPVQDGLLVADAVRQRQQVPLRSGVRAPPGEAGLVVLEPGGVGGALVVEQPPELFGFEVVVCVVAVSSLRLIVTGSTLPSAVQLPLAVVAVCTPGAALYGQRLARRRPPETDRWRPAHLQLMWGSVTSLVSAVAVGSAPPVVWVPVIVLCSGLTHAATGRVRAGVSGGVPPPGTTSRRWLFRATSGRARWQRQN